MASSCSSSSSSLANPGATVNTNKRLGELLKEQQEPFLLDVYLLERGYPSTRRKGRRGGHYYSTTATNDCFPCPCNISDTNLKRFHSRCYGFKLNTPMRVVRNLSIPNQIHPKVPTTLRNIDKLLPVSISNRRTTKPHHLRACHDDERVEVAAPPPPPPKLELHKTHIPQVEFDRFSSATSRSIENVNRSNDQQLQLVSPAVSVPLFSSQQDHIPSSSANGKSTLIPSQSNYIGVTEDFILSASLWDLLLQRSLAQKQGSGGVEAVLRDLLGSGGLDSSSSCHSQYVKTKRVLQQTRQLLFDCVREAVEKDRRRRRWHGGVDHEFIGAEELGKIICEEIHEWGKQSVDLTNLNQMVEADVSEERMEEEEGWSGFLNLKAHNSIGNEIGMGIADAILDEMTNEIVTDMIHIHIFAFNAYKSKRKTIMSSSSSFC